MARKLANLFYDLSPTETLTFRITGPVDPRVTFDGTALPVQGAQGVTIMITPAMTGEVGAVHDLTLFLTFLPGVQGSYTIDVSDLRGPLNSFTVNGPNQENFTRVDILLEIVDVPGVAQ